MIAEQLFQFEDLELNDEDFTWFAEALRNEAGISLNDSKRSLLKGRLRPRMKALGLANFADYRWFLAKLSKHDSEWQKFINAMTTNKTDWFREPRHFDFLIRQYIPMWRRSGRKNLNVWSVACSTGEEPYTLAIVLKHHLFRDETFKIYATDIDSAVLKIAQNGVYPRDKVSEQVPPEYLSSSFAVGTGEIFSWVKIKNTLREHVSFSKMNLLTIPDNWHRDIDVAFCRNVLIYFDHENVEKVVNNIWNHCAHGAMFAVGHSESLQSIKSPWRFAQPSVYLKPEKPPSNRRGGFDSERQ
ncbi:protein-glutamate O-methyltransferase CheR [bacterium]|nr:protein-glutamate O-methyltransferase CheR [bacterium]